MNMGNIRPAASWMGLAALTAATLLGQTGLPAMATAEGGSVTGRIVWCAAAPVPLGAAISGSAEGGAGVGVPQPAPAPDVSTLPQTIPSAPDQQGPFPSISVPDQQGPGGIAQQIYPVPIPSPRPIPAGAVLVAVQGTGLNTRTDEAGQFRLDGVPVGQYLTLGAGPVKGLSTAMVVRPNVFVSGSGQALDLGTLSLGQPCGFRFGGPLGADAAGVESGVAVPNVAGQGSAPDQGAAVTGSDMSAD